MSEQRNPHIPPAPDNCTQPLVWQWGYTDFLAGSARPSIYLVSREEWTAWRNGWLKAHLEISYAIDEVPDDDYLGISDLLRAQHKNMMDGYRTIVASLKR